MESTKELREMCQKPRESCDTWHGRRIARPVSIYITMLFLKFNMSANIATGIFLVCGLISSLLLISTSRVMFFTGVFLFQIWYILDHVDGEIARYKRQTSITGMYFDHMVHYIVHPLLFICLGFGIFLRNSGVSYIIFGIIAGLSTELLSAVVDLYDFNLQKIKKYSNKIDIQVIKPLGFLKSFFTFLHTLCTFPIVIDILLVCAILDVLLGIPFINFFLIFYAVLLTFVWLSKFIYIVTSKKLDRGHNFENKYSHLKL
jgi:phosphatidylglycerophosphate synthase